MNLWLYTEGRRRRNIFHARKRKVNDNEIIQFGSNEIIKLAIYVINKIRVIFPLYFHDFSHSFGARNGFTQCVLWARKWAACQGSKFYMNCAFIFPNIDYVKIFVGISSAIVIFSKENVLKIFLSITTTFPSLNLKEKHPNSALSFDDVETFISRWWMLIEDYTASHIIHLPTSSFIWCRYCVTYK